MYEPLKDAEQPQLSTLPSLVAVLLVRFCAMEWWDTEFFSQAHESCHHIRKNTILPVTEKIKETKLHV